MTVRSTKLASGTVSGAGLHNVYTVPAGSTVITKSLAAQNQGGGTSGWSLGLTPSGGGLTLDFFGHSLASPEAAGAWDSVSFWHVLNAGDKLYIYIDSGGPVAYWLSGAVLS